MVYHRGMDEGMNIEFINKSLPNEVKLVLEMRIYRIFTSDNELFCFDEAKCTSDGQETGIDYLPK